MSEPASDDRVVAFMDIAGAGPLWARDPNTMRAAMSVYDDVVRSRLAAFEGPTLQAVGTGTMTVWPNAARAVRFLLSVQEGLTNASWPAALLEQPEASVVMSPAGSVTLAGLRCQMAVHSGAVRTDVARMTDGGAVRRVARVAQAAHGGQILLTSSVRSAVESSTGGDLQVRTLGTRLLRGVRGAVELFDVRSPFTAARSFPPPRTRDVEKSNHVPARDAFVGRSADRAAIEELLSMGVRCVALVGPPGRGRSRLSSALLDRAESRWVHESGGGAWVIRLPSEPSLNTFLTEVGTALDVDLSSLTSTSDAAQQIARVLAPRGPVLLVFQGIDVWTEGLLAVLHAWTRRVANLQILTTSTRPVRMASAVSYRVGPLQTDGGLRSAGARLLLRRIRERGGDVPPSAHDAVDRLVALSDGSPLVIEMLAGQAMSRPTADLAAAMQARDEPDPVSRALTVCQGNLPTWMRGALQRLAVVVGPFTAETAAEVAGLNEWVAAPSPTDALLLMVERGLLHRTPPLDHPALLRFALHPAIRDRLLQQAPEPERDEALLRYARHALRAAQPWVTALNGEHGEEALAVLGSLRGMLVRALQTGLARAQSDPDGLPLALEALLSLDALMTRQGLPDAHEAYLDQAVALSEQAETPPVQLVRILRARARVRYLRGSARPARDDLEAARDLGRRLNDREAEGIALGALGQLQASIGQMTEAVETLTQALALLVVVDTPRETAAVRAALGSALTQQGDARGAEEHLAAAVRGFRAGADARSEALARTRLGTARRRLGKLDAARKELEESISAHEVFGNRRRLAEAMEQLGAVATQQGRYAEASRVLSQALDLSRAVGAHRVAGRIACRLGMVLVEQGDAVEAREFFHEGLAMAAEVRSHSVESLAHVGLGILQHSLGKPDRAVEHLRQSAYSMTGRAEPRIQTATLSLWAACSAELGQTDEATQTMHVVLARMGDANDPWVDHSGTLCQLWVEAEGSNWSDASVLKMRGLIEGLRSVPEVPLVVRVLYRLAEERLDRATFQTQ